MFKKLCGFLGAWMVIASAGASDLGASLIDCALYAIVGLLLMAAVIIPTYTSSTEENEHEEF